MIRVIHLINSLDIGGGERFAVDVIQRLDRRRFEPQVVSLHGTGPLEDDLASFGIPAHSLHLDLRLNVLGLLRVWRTLRGLNGHVLHAHLPEACWYGLPAGRLAGIPVRIGHVQSTHRGWATRFRLLDRLASNFATRMVACSEAVHHFCETELGYRPGKTRVIHNAIDIRRFQNVSPRNEARRRLGLPLRGPILACVASLRDPKGHVYLLRAMVRIQAAIPGALLLLVGEGSLRPQLERMTMSLAISDAVRFFGIRTDIPLILAASDMFLLASLREGLPLALAEAGAASLPAVATRVDGICEVIDDGVTGLLVPPEDSDQLAVAVITLLEDRERAREMGRRAREHVGERFDINPAVRKVENLYDEAVRETRGI